MKLMEFTYTKANGEISNRSVIVAQEPNKLFGGYDVSELPDEQYAAFVQDFSILKNRQHEEMIALVTKHDLKHNYRQFTPDKMSNVTTDWV